MADLALTLDVSIWRASVDIILVATLIYRVLLLLRGSRSGAVLAAAALLFGGFYLSQDTLLDLPTVNWLLDRLIGSLVVLLVVLFQDDIRRALASAVRAPLWRAGTDPRQDAVVSEVQRAAGCSANAALARSSSSSTTPPSIATSKPACKSTRRSRGSC